VKRGSLSRPGYSPSDLEWGESDRRLPLQALFSSRFYSPFLQRISLDIAAVVPRFFSPISGRFQRSTQTRYGTLVGCVYWSVKASHHGVADRRSR